MLIGAPIGFLYYQSPGLPADVASGGYSLVEDGQNYSGEEGKCLKELDGGYDIRP